MKKFFQLISAIFITLNFVAYSNPGSELRTVKDMLGAEVKIVKTPTKVACVSRSTADFLIAFGVGDAIDGVYKTILDNEWVPTIYPETESFYSYEYEENLETFFSREIDLILSPESRISENLKSKGLPALTVNHYGNPTYDDLVFYMPDLIDLLWGEREGVSKKINDWKNDFNKAKDIITTELSRHDIPKNQTIYYVRGDKNKGIGYTENTKPYMEYIYRLLGFEHIGQRFETNKPSVEEIMQIDPDVIVIGGVYQHVLDDLIQVEAPWNELSAVKNDRVYKIPIGITAFEQTSSLSPIFLYDQANKLYPEYFNFDIAKLTKESYIKYFNIELTDLQISYMLNGKNMNGENLK